jgi:Fic family protein
MLNTLYRKRAENKVNKILILLKFDASFLYKKYFSNEKVYKIKNIQIHSKFTENTSTKYFPHLTN